MQGDVQRAALEEALQAGNVEAALDALNLDPAAFDDLHEELRGAFRQGGIAETAAQPKAPVAMRFAIGNPTAQRIAASLSSNLITNILEETKELARQRIAAGISAGENPRTTALTLTGRVNLATGIRSGGIMGLARNQAEWVQNAERELTDLDARYFTRKLRDKRFDPTVRKAIKSGKGLSASAREKILNRYRARLLKLRGDTIGRTESISSLNAGRVESVRQMVEKGLIKDEDVKKVWSATLDARVRDIHRLLNGKEQKFDEPFVSPVTGSLLQYPGDTSLGAKGQDTINCRCYLEIDIDWIGGPKQVNKRGKKDSRLDETEDDFNAMIAGDLDALPREQAHRARPAFINERDNPSLLRYTAKGYIGVNKGLISGQPLREDRKKIVADMLNLSRPIKQNMRLFRGESYTHVRNHPNLTNYKDRPPLMAGHITSSPAFTSTSTSPFIGKRFSQTGGKQYGRIWDIRAPASTKGIVTNDYEQEVILRPETKLRVLQVDKWSDNRERIVAEIVE